MTSLKDRSIGCGGWIALLLFLGLIVGAAVWLKRQDRAAWEERVRTDVRRETVPLRADVEALRRRVEALEKQ